MFYRGTGKADHGYRVSVIMDADSRFVLGYSVGTYHKEKPKKGEKYSELEKSAIAMAEKTLEEFGVVDKKTVVDEHGESHVITEPMKVIDPGKNKRCSAFFGTLAAEFLWRYDYKTVEELKAFVDDYIDYYNNHRIHSMLCDNGNYPVKAFKKNAEDGKVGN